MAKKAKVRLKKWNGKKLIKTVRTEFQKRLLKAAIFLENEIKKEIGTKGVKCDTDKGERSNPGDPPFLECGELRRSITHEILRDKAIVGSNKKYAKYLELGTRYMEKRPFLRPTLKKHRRTIRRILFGKKFKGL